MTLTQNQAQTLKEALDKRYDALLEEVRDELERTHAHEGTPTL